MATTTLPVTAPPTFQSAVCNNTSSNLLGTPVVADEDLPRERKEKKEKKDKKSKDKKKNKKKAKKSDKDAVEEANSIRQAVGVIVIDPATQQVLMLESRKKQGAYVLPRDDCQTKPNEEHPEKTALRLLHEKAGVSTSFLSSCVGSYSESNKKGKVIAQHWMYEVHTPTLLDSWPNADRQRVWVPYEEALKATENKRMSHLALTKCTLAKKAAPTTTS